AGSWQPRDGPGRSSIRRARPCGSPTSWCSQAAPRARSTPRRCDGFSSRRTSGSRSISGSDRTRRGPWAPTSRPNTCASMPNTPRRDVLVLKIGGSVGAETDAALDAAVALNDGGHSLVVVHGGGPAVGEWAERLGMDTRFVRGLRVTDPATRDLAMAVLG